MSELPKLQFITHETEKYSLVDSAQIALDAGVRWVQFRYKNPRSASELMEKALNVKRLCDEYSALFTINDYVDLIKDVGAAGLHIGKSDIDIKEARRILGSQYIIGGTANTFEDIECLHNNIASYIGLGPFRFTTTKQNLSDILHLKGYENILAKCKANNINIPIFAIGGVEPIDAIELKKCGVYGIAISSALLNSADPITVVNNFLENLK